MSFSVFGMLFGVAAMVFAIFSFLLEVCPDECGGDGDCCTRQRVAERLVCQRCAANTEPDDDKVKLKAKDVANVVQDVLHGAYAGATARGSVQQGRHVLASAATASRCLPTGCGYAPTSV